MRYRIFLNISLTGLLAACTVGPDYVRPKAPGAAHFKEADGWKQATPRDTEIRGNWWEMFGDPQLNQLEQEVNISNQNIKLVEAQFRQAQAMVSEARAAYYPTVTANGSVTRSGSGGGSRGGRGVGVASQVTTVNNTGGVITSGGTASGNTIVNSYDASLGASWELDVWGKIRRTVESEKALAQASDADLAAARLSVQSTLAVDYFSLRVADVQHKLLEETAANYRKNLTLTQNLYESGVSARSDVLQAQVQLESTLAQSEDTGVLRAQYEHAIAMLIGKTPAELRITDTGLLPPIPGIPTGVASSLLERRPDIAAAERRADAANAQIGVAEAAYYPDFTLSASGGYESSSFAQWFSLPNRIWSIGPAIAQTLFDGGLRRAQTEAAIAAYDQTVATYRQTTLAAFQEVEDDLVALRILEREAELEAQTVKDAKQSVAIAINQYKAGTQNYLNVITTEQTALSNEESALVIEKSRLTSAANLIAALGGGWNVPADTGPSNDERLEFLYSE